MTSNKKVMLTGTVIASAILGLTAVQASANAGYTHLGTGAEVRAKLTGHNTANTLELACGAKKDSASAGKTKEGKCAQGKCGEAKCGNKKDGKKKEKKEKKADTSKSGR